MDHLYTRATFGRRLNVAKRANKLVKFEQRLDVFGLRNYIAWGSGAGANWIASAQIGLAVNLRGEDVTIDHAIRPSSVCFNCIARHSRPGGCGRSSASPRLRSVSCQEFPGVQPQDFAIIPTIIPGLAGKSRTPKAYPSTVLILIFSPLSY